MKKLKKIPAEKKATRFESEDKRLEALYAKLFGELIPVASLEKKKGKS